MRRHTLRIPWAGPAVALALLFSAMATHPALAAPAAPVTVANDSPMCVGEAFAYAGAVGDWISAWDNYQTTLPGGTASEIQGAVDQLNGATDNVVRTGVRLFVCLLKYIN